MQAVMVAMMLGRRSDRAALHACALLSCVWMPTGHLIGSRNLREPTVYMAELRGSKLVVPELETDVEFELRRHPALSPRLVKVGDLGRVWLLGNVVGDPTTRVQLAVDGNTARGSVRLANGTRIHFNASVAAQITMAKGDAIGPRARHKRHVLTNGWQGFNGGARRRCTVAIDADESFFERWGGEGSHDEQVANVQAKLLEVAHAVDGVLSDPQNFGDSLGIQVVSINVHTGLHFVKGVATDDDLDRESHNVDGPLPSSATSTEPDENSDNIDSAFDAYKQWLAGTVAGGAIAHGRSVAADEVCMNLLFTHSNFDGPLGASTIGAESNRGACANSPLQVGETAESTNAALVTSNHYGMSVSLSTLVHTAVHELGHSWGAQHTCCVTGSDCAAGFACDDEQVFSQCNPSTGDKFVMHPILGEDMISLLFSTCSRDAMSALLARRSECVRASECAFGGSCCEGRRHVRRRGTMCRAPPVFNSCELAHTCDGVSALCPSDPQYAPDGTACLLPSFGDKQSIRFGVCLNATCSPQHHDHCTRKGLHGCTGGDPCRRSCRDSSGTCVDEAWRAPAGYPCATSEAVRGLCTASGLCDVGAGTDLVEDLANRVSESCAWEEATWSRCSADCGGGQTSLGFECRCSSGGVDESGRLCSDPKPSSPTKPCNDHPCGTCSVVAVKSTASLVSGTYAALPDDGEGLGPLYMNDAGMRLFKVILNGRSWWGIGPFSRATYRWMAFVSAADGAAQPPMGTSTWLHGGTSAPIEVNVRCLCPYADSTMCGSTTATTLTSTTSLMHSTSSIEPTDETLPT